MSHLESFLKNYGNVFFTKKVENKVLFSKKRCFLGSRVRHWEKASNWEPGLALSRAWCPARSLVGYV